MTSEEAGFGDAPESFDEAAPVAVPKAKPRHESLPRHEPKLNGHATKLPFSLEAEEALISCALIDAGDVMQKAEAVGITPAAFYEPKNAILFDAIRSIHGRKIAVDVSVLAEELKASSQLEKIGGVPYLVQVSGHTATTAQAAYFLDKVHGLALLREAIREHALALEGAAGLDSSDVAEFFDRTAERLHRLRQRALGGSMLPVARGASSFDYPSKPDPSVLLGSDDYLCRGGGMLFVSHAGAGKSSWIYDAAMTWACGQPWMGLRCHGQLKTLVIQGEDSDRYIGKIVGSYRHVHGIESGSAGMDLLDRNFVVAEVRGTHGAEFLRVLRSLVAMHKPDLVVINPVYIYAEGEISKGEVVQKFLVGLDAINADKKFGYILVHHTGKPAKKEGSKKTPLEDWESAYQGIGSSFWANWPRCSVLLEPVAEKRGLYWLRLGKGGFNAGITTKVPQGVGYRLEPTTKIGIRHSQQRISVDGVDKPCIYWEQCEIAEGDAENVEDESDISKYSWATFAPYLSDKAPLSFNNFHRICCQVPGPHGIKIEKGALARLIDNAEKAGLVEKTMSAAGASYRRIS